MALQLLLKFLDQLAAAEIDNYDGLSVLFTVIYLLKFFVKPGTCINVITRAMSKNAVGGKASNAIL